MFIVLRYVAIKRFVCEDHNASYHLKKTPKHNIRVQGHIHQFCNNLLVCHIWNVPIVYYNSP